MITLLTDFGLADTYVGQVKGALLRVSSTVTLVDVTHAVPPQDVVAGAFLLWSAVEAFPPGSIHVAVVDPGVGSPRRAIAILSDRGDLFVGPDNGLLVPAVERLGGAVAAVELTKREYWRTETSSTFHGRDIFGPVAGHLANGVPLERIGTPITDPTRLELPKPRGLDGKVIHVDTYGNLITNFRESDLRPDFEISVNGHRIPRAAFYAAAKPGALVALVGSAGLLEVAARDASAAQITAAARGTRVTLTPR